MALTDRFKDLKSKAEEAVVERKDQIQGAVQKAGEVADQRTGGKYHDKIEKAGGKALGYVQSLDGDKGVAPTESETTGGGPSAPGATAEEPPPPSAA
jgi:antitoxin protein of toxin-antitoxin system